MTGSPAEPEADDARISRLFLESLRDGRLADARIQIEALDDVTPREPRFTFDARANCELRPNPRQRSNDGPRHELRRLASVRIP